MERRKKTHLFHSYIMPHIYHNINIKNKETGSTQDVKHYKFGNKWGPRGETWWSSYRYQLEALVDKIKGREPAYWINPEDTIAEMHLVEDIYIKSGLGERHSMLGVQSNK